MSDNTLIRRAWAAFEQQHYADALMLFRQAERRHGNLFSVNITMCLRELAKISPILLPGCDLLQTQMAVLSSLRPAKRKLVAGIASMPSRLDTLAKVLAKVVPQVDAVHLYLNNFEQVPAFACQEKVTVHRSQQYGDLRDNGKFFGVQYCDDDSYYFTLDDDLDYPHGYFAALVSKIEQYQGKAAVGLHGVIYAWAPRTFFDRLTFNFERELRVDIPVSVVGTGTVGFYTGVIKPPMSAFTDTGMADLMFAAFLKQHGIPAICIARPQNWLKEYVRADRSDAIYQQTRMDTARYDRFLAVNSPWGIACIGQAAANNGLQLSDVAISFINWLAESEQTGSTAAVRSAAAAKFRSVFEICGYPALADNYYRGVASAILQRALTETYNLPDDVRRFCEQIELQYKVELNLDLCHSTAELAIAELKRYVAISNNKELAIKLGMIELLQAPERSRPQLDLVVQYLLSLGNSALILHHLPLLQPVLSQKSLVHLLKTLMLDGEPITPSLLTLLRALPQDTPPLMFINCLLLLSQHSRGVDAALVAFMTSHIPDEVKLGYIRELLTFYADSGDKPVAEAFKPVLENAGSPASIKRLVAQLLLSTEMALDAELNDTIVTLVAAEAAPTETALWQAELNYQHSGDITPIITALNTLFITGGLSAVSYQPKDDSSFLAALHTDVTKGGSNLGRCSVVIAAYAAEATLQYAYDSICKQSYADLEIIVVDDFCEVPVTAYLQLDPAVITKVIRNTRNLGPYGCRNEALKVASGDYFMVHDADDWAHPQKVAQQILSLQHENLVRGFSRHIRATQYGHLKLENHGMFIGHGPMTSMFKMSVFTELGPFDPVPTRGDMEFKSRIKRFYGEQAIYEDQRLMLISLDWQSNSKKKTATVAKKVQLAQYKNEYAAWQQLVPFWRKAATIK